MSDTEPPDEPSEDSLHHAEAAPRPDEAGTPTPPQCRQRPADTQRAPRMIDLRLLAPATATWAASWWATAHPTPLPLIAALALASGLTTASYAWSHRNTHPPRHALTPPRSLRLGAALLLATTACALAVASAAGASYLADPARSQSGPIHASVRLERDPAPASSGSTTRHRARVRILAVRVGDRWVPSQASARGGAPGGGGGGGGGGR